MAQSEQLVLGLDLGTSGVRAVAVDTTGELIGETSRPYSLLTPRPGWTEQNPGDWLRSSLEALRELAGKLEGSEVLALGLSGQMHGMVPLDRHGQVVRPAILWNDQRTGRAVTEIEAKVPREELISRTGNPAITGFQLSKLVWLRSEEPENFSRTRHVLLPKDFLGYALTGNMIAEPSDASGTNCFNLRRKCWDSEILSALDLDAGLFPPVVASHEVAGGLTSEMALASGLPSGLPVVAGAGDNAAAAIGLGISSRTPEQGSVSLGTSGVIFAPLQEATPDPEGRVHLFCHADGGYHLLAVTLAAAGSLQWYRDNFAPELDFAAIVGMAEASPPGSNGVTFKPYLAGERTPHMDPDLRGSWTGLSLATTRADIARSILEGVAFSLRDALEVMKPLSNLGQCLVTGGGVRSELWLEIVGDILQLTLSRPERNQGPAYGAALLALQGISLTRTATELVDAAAATSREAGSFEPYLEAWRRYLS
jgi:xylulokinase